MGKILVAALAAIGLSAPAMAVELTETFTTHIIKPMTIHTTTNQFQHFYLPFFDRSLGVLNSVTLGIGRVTTVNGSYDTNGPPAESLFTLVHSDAWAVDPAFSIETTQGDLPPDQLATISGFFEPVYNLGRIIPEKQIGSLDITDTFSDAHTYTAPKDTIIFIGDPTQTYSGDLFENLAFDVEAFSGTTENLVELTDYSFSVTYDYTSDAVPADPDPSVPEPATWSMMIVGLGAIGTAMRRRRLHVAFG